VERPTEGSNQVKTTAISADQARALLAVPNPTTLKGKRDHCHPIGFPMKSAFFANFDFLHCLKTRWKSELTQNPL
jgi:hypothetical protein